MSARIGVTRDVGHPWCAAIVCHRAGSRTSATMAASVCRSSDATTPRPTSPVAPVTTTVRGWIISGLHRERGPVCTVTVGEQQQALAGRDRPTLECVAQVDEVV